MRIASILILWVFLFGQQRTNEPGSWLDSVREWQFSAAELRRGQSQNPNPQCDTASREPQGAAERLLVGEGWKLAAASVSRRDRASLIEVVQGFRQYDGMCRPLNFQAFVFINDRPIGTLSPRLMNSREDGAMNRVSISDSGEITANFLRYRATDALCCPSRESLAVYSVMQEAGNYRLKLLRVETKARATP
jgi:hypothetical protein